ncbi:12161_t:CDS:2 [Funneliformis geosporum]|nr:12161_t:CDS:2 [Funneliformis geosporum]
MSKDDIDVLDESINRGHVKFYEFSFFENIQIKGDGAFGDVYSANYKGRNLALKIFKKVQNFFEEFKIHLKISHENIIQYYGIAKKIDESNSIKYSIVMELADCNLATYLERNISDLDWNNKYDLSFQLASAINYLHEEDIIHCDLVADFGLSKKTTEVSSDVTQLYGVIPYIEPKCFNDKSYKPDKKSDVYSIGVLMWQISSGFQPFSRENFNIEPDILGMKIGLGMRESVVDGTPDEYTCWNNEPRERPDMRKVFSTLEARMYPELHTVNSISIVCNGGNNLSITRISKSSPSISIKSRDSNISRLDVNCAIYQTKLLPTISTNSNQLTHKADAIVNVSSQSKRSSIISTIPIESTFNEMSNVIADMIINYIIKEHDKSIGFCKIKSIFEQEIKLLCKAIRDLLHWLKKNQHESKYIWFHGLFCYYITNDSKESFKLFSEASKGNFAIAKVYLAKCYIDGYGTDRNNKKAFDLFKESVEIGSICGQFYLGYCYENGIGTKMDEKKSIEWYTNAANNANAPAIYYLAECYRSGKGVKVDEATAVKWYEALAKLEIVEAQLQLGNCNRYGIGVKINVEGACDWYKKAAINGDLIAQDILKKNYNAAKNGCKVAQFDLGNCYRLGYGVKEKNERIAFELFNRSAKQGYINGKFRLGYCYDYGVGVEINKTKAFWLNKIAAKKGNTGAQNNLGVLYENGEGTEKNLDKAIKWYGKAAKKGDDIAQFNLGTCYKLGIGVEINERKAFELYKKSSEKENNGAQYEFKALEYYKQSAEKGFTDAQYQLGYFYHNGFGTEKKEDEALKFYGIAAEKEHRMAQNNLGLLYENRQDLKSAAYWYIKAADNGYNVAQYNLGRCYESGIGVEVNESKSFEYYDKAAKQGHCNAQIYCEYLNSIRTKVNETEALYGQSSSK